MYDQTHYWITPDGTLIDVPDTHQRTAKRVAGISKEEAFRQGWVRVIRADNLGKYWFFEIQSVHDLRALELVGEFVMAADNDLTGDDVAASIFTSEPQQGSFPVEWKDLEEMSFAEAAQKSFLRESRRPAGYKWYELRGAPRRRGRR